jgi:FkbM family methyltransferase
MFSKSIKDKNNLLVAGRLGSRYLVPNLKENIGFEIFINGIYERDTIEFIASRLPAGATLLDIGANIGAITIPVSKLRNDIKIVCIEAAPWIFSVLNKNISLNGFSNRVSLVNKAVSDQDNLTVNFYSPQDQFGKGSLSAVFTNEGVSVSTITLSSILAANQNVSFIKVDVEGHEYAVFAGGKNHLIAEDAPDVLFEFVDWAESNAGFAPGDAQRLLMSFGYRLYIFDRQIRGEINDPQTVGACMFFASKKKNSFRQ